jgi:hypothetical protein
MHIEKLQEEKRDGDGVLIDTIGIYTYIYIHIYSLVYVYTYIYIYAYRKFAAGEKGW